MLRTLYFKKEKFLCGSGQKSVHEQFLTRFNLKPFDSAHDSLKKKVLLKKHLKWKEVQDFQNILAKADFWDSFPKSGVRLISAESKCGGLRQRLDCLYLRPDGGIFPCELKIGRTTSDPVGQLLRYLADLDEQTITKSWILKRRQAYLSRLHAGEEGSKLKIKHLLSDFEQKLSGYDAFRFIRNHGVIIGEDFSPHVLQTVRFLNVYFGFALRLIKVTAYVAEDWMVDSDEWLMRLEFRKVSMQAETQMF